MAQLRNHAVPTVSIASASHTAGTPVNGTGVSRKGFRHVAILFTTGAIAATSIAVKLQHSTALGSGYVDAPGWTMSPILGAETNRVIGWDLHVQEDSDLLEFIRPVITPTGGTATVAVTILRYNAVDKTWTEAPNGDPLARWDAVTEKPAA